MIVNLLLLFIRCLCVIMQFALFKVIIYLRAINLKFSNALYNINMLYYKCMLMSKNM